MINIFNTLIKNTNRNECLKEDGIYGNNYLIKHRYFFFFSFLIKHSFEKSDIIYLHV